MSTDTSPPGLIGGIIYLEKSICSSIRCLVSVIIVNYNTRDYLERCLHSLFEHTKNVSFEVIVIDNASSDDSVQVIKYKYPKVTVIESDRNLGFGAANNHAFDEAKGKYIFFLNPDTVLMNNAISILAAYLEAHPQVALCGGNLFTAEGTPNGSYSLSVHSRLREFCIALNIRYAGNKEHFNIGESKKVGTICGADMMIKRTVFERVGRFNEKFFMYYEEPDLCSRIQKAGFEVHFVPEAKIIHFEGASTNLNTVFDKPSKFFYISSQLFYARLHLKDSYPFLWLIHFSKSLLGFILYSLKKNERRKTYWQNYLLTVCGKSFNPGITK